MYVTALKRTGVPVWRDGSCQRCHKNDLWACTEEMCNAEALDLADRKITPTQMPVVAGAIAVNPAIIEIRLDSNPITGTKYYGDSKMVEEYDCDPTAFVALLEAMKSSAMSKLSISDCDIGPKGLMTLASPISAIAAVNEVTLDQNPITGPMYKRRSSGWSQTPRFWFILTGNPLRK